MDLNMVIYKYVYVRRSDVASKCRYFELWFFFKCQNYFTDYGGQLYYTTPEESMYNL